MAGRVRFYARQGEPEPRDRGDSQDRGAGARRAGDVGPRRRRAMGREERGDAKRMAITGFCWAGASCGCMRRAAPRFARRSPGTARSRRRRTAPAEAPIDIAKELKAPVLGLYGGADAGNSPTRASIACAMANRGGGETHANPHVSRRAARVLRRLPAELSQARRQTTAGSACSSGSGATASHGDRQTAWARSRTTSRGELRRLLESRTLTTVFQPIYGFRDARVIGFEALVRGRRAAPCRRPRRSLRCRADEGLGNELNVLASPRCCGAFAARRFPGTCSSTSRRNSS
jgi:hypothetical protein